jgi:hypothetical protein
MIPKNNVWLKYIKGSRKKTDEELLKYIANFYTISLGEAEDYIYFLKKEGVEEILKKSGVDEKIIKEMIKKIKI